MSNELLDELRKGTDFQYVSGEDIAGFTDRPLVSTPIESLNCFLGGGIPIGAIVACSGGNAAGKSSAAYEIMGNFQKEHPDGIAMILDSEASIDPLRLSQLGVDVSKVLILPAGTLESGFDQINKILSKKAESKKLSKIPVMIIWDTISAAPTASQAEKGGAYAGGMAEAPRVIKNGLKQIYGLVSSQNVLLVLINQITAELGGWKPTTGISGGNALATACSQYYILTFSAYKIG